MGTSLHIIYHRYLDTSTLFERLLNTSALQNILHAVFVNGCVFLTIDNDLFQLIPRDTNYPIQVANNYVTRVYDNRTGRHGGWYADL
jgi:hypothetical protein